MRNCARSSVIMPSIVTRAICFCGAKPQLGAAGNSERAERDRAGQNGEPAPQRGRALQAAAVEHGFDLERHGEDPYLQWSETRFCHAKGSGNRAAEPIRAKARGTQTDKALTATPFDATKAAMGCMSRKPALAAAPSDAGVLVATSSTLDLIRHEASKTLPRVLAGKLGQSSEDENDRAGPPSDSGHRPECCGKTHAPARHRAVHRCLGHCGGARRIRLEIAGTGHLCRRRRPLDDCDGAEAPPALSTGRWSRAWASSRQGRLVNRPKWVTHLFGIGMFVFPLEWAEEDRVVLRIATNRYRVVAAYRPGGRTGGLLARPIVCDHVLADAPAKSGRWRRSGAHLTRRQQADDGGGHQRGERAGDDRRGPRSTMSSRRLGAMATRPPIMMPRLPRLAKPHSA